MDDKVDHNVDDILRGFLEDQHAAGTALAAASDVLELAPLAEPGEPPQRYIACFKDCGLVRVAPGDVRRAPRVVFGIRFTDQHLRDCNSFELITLLEPVGLFHSNVRFPAVCLGQRFVRPGTTLVEILFRLYDVVSYRLWTANDPLNDEAAEWLRAHQDRVPLPVPPLKRRPAGSNLSNPLNVGPGIVRVVTVKGGST